MLWMRVSIYFVLVLGVSYAVASRQIGGKAVAKRFPLVILIIGVAVGMVALLQQLPGNWSDVGSSGSLIVLSFLLWLFLGEYIGKKAQAGSVLLNIGRRRGGLILGPTGFVCSLLGGIFSVVPMFETSEASVAREIRQMLPVPLVVFRY